MWVLMLIVYVFVSFRSVPFRLLFKIFLRDGHKYYL